MFKSKSPRHLRLLAFFCCLAYFASYLTRINYTAVRLAIADALVLTHPELVAELGIAISAASVSYGLGQFVSGFLGDKIPPTALVGIGLGGAVLCNLAMPLLYPAVYLMAAVWGIGGFFQALIRPPLGRIIAANYDEKGYLDTCVAVSNSSQFATIFVYLAIPLCLHLSGGDWTLSFYLPAAFGAITLGFWCCLVPRLCTAPSGSPSDTQDAENTQPAPVLPLMLRSRLLLFLLPVLIHGLLRDGITAWMPDFIAEVGGFETGISILTTAILPLFCIVCVILTKKLCQAIPSDGKSSALFFALSALSAGIIVPLLNRVNVCSFAVIVLLMALITGCMHAVNHIFITRIPRAFKAVGRVSGIVGVLNAVTYIGSALSPYAVALVAGAFGWNMAVLFWAVLAALSILFCLAASRGWDAFRQAPNKK